MFSFAFGDSLNQEKILIINNTNDDVILEQPIQRNVSSQFPSVINAHGLGEIIIEIKNDWLMDTAFDVHYQQALHNSDTFMTLYLSKNTPSPDLLEPFTPGFTCRLEFEGDSAQMSLISVGKNGNYCNTFYLY